MRHRNWGGGGSSVTLRTGKQELPRQVSEDRSVHKVAVDTTCYRSINHKNIVLTNYVEKSLVGKLKIIQLAQKLLPFTEPTVSLPCSE